MLLLLLLLLFLLFGGNINCHVGTCTWRTFKHSTMKNCKLCIVNISHKTTHIQQPLQYLIYIFGTRRTSSWQVRVHVPSTKPSFKNGLAPFRVLVAQLVEHPPGVRKVMGSNLIGDSDFFSEFIYVCFNYSFNT